MSSDPAPNWLVVSMTTFPASDPAAASASSITGHGTETTTTSLSATASDAFSATDARGPISAASRSSAPGSRENVTITSCPASARKCARLPPMCPAPMMPTRTITLLESYTSPT
jgi:hypothetical protein